MIAIMTLTHPDRLEVHHDETEQTPPGTVTQQPTAGHQPPTNRPSFTITDAAVACAVSRKTITRKLPELAGHGAAKDEDGVWRIPVEALLAVGLRPGRSLPDATPATTRPVAARPTTARHQSGPPVSQDTITIARDRWDDLRIRLARAEAEASERALALADARLALRALTAGPARSASTSNSAPTSDSQTGPTVVVPQPAGPANTAVSPGMAPTEQALAMSGGSGPSGEPQSPALLGANDQPVAATPGPPGATSDVIAARVRAAQTGGHVPAGATMVKKRRWWQSAR